MLKSILNLLGKVTGFGSIGNVVDSILTAKNDPSTENIASAEHALVQFVSSEVSAEISEDIRIAQPVIDSVFSYIEYPADRTQHAKEIGAGIVIFAKHFRPEIPQQHCDDLIVAIEQILNDEGV